MSRAAIKRALVMAYCHGFAPAWLVAAAFKWLKLRSM